jgi:ubiquinone biosynthesis protein UbiJ
VLGDSLAHRVVGAGRAVLQLQARAAASLARNLSEYWLDEQPLIARRDDVARWLREVDTLRDDVERLAQRIERL